MIAVWANQFLVNKFERKIVNATRRQGIYDVAVVVVKLLLLSLVSGL